MASAAPASSPRRRRLCFAGQDSGGLARFAAIFPQCNKMASEIETYDDIAEALRCGFRFFGAGGAPPCARRPPLGPRACLIFCSSTRKPLRLPIHRCIHELEHRPTTLRMPPGPGPG